MSKHLLKHTYRALGLMSGSSLDGLDIAYCEIQVARSPEFRILHSDILVAETLPFSEQWVVRLKNLPQQNALVFAKTHTYFAHYLADLVKEFCIKNKVKPDFISSHGHTIFHQPENRITVQIGDGAALAGKTGYPVICDFRTHDIALNGEGTPLAPIADKWLYPGYDLYLNIGGIANISCDLDRGFIAYDIGVANQIFNTLANLAGKDYDESGDLARAGKVNQELLAQVNEIAYFSQSYPKSLDNSWISQNILPLYLEAEISLEDKMCTAVEQLAQQLQKEIEIIKRKEKLNRDKYRIFATGGGVFNTFLIERMQELCVGTEIVLPEPKVINFKEAALMALLGVLRVENQVNCLSSVTGAKFDTIGGAIYQGRKRFV
ncbi:MAG: anhydro-N-acetylmuramic acid kinase [Saprospiraceae bacterium]|jgi:anhydro-N-acetylmuramic acid kinase